MNVLSVLQTELKCTVNKEYKGVICEAKRSNRLAIVRNVNPLGSSRKSEKHKMRIEEEELEEESTKSFSQERGPFSKYSCCWIVKCCYLTAGWVACRRVAGALHLPLTRACFTICCHLDKHSESRWSSGYFLSIWCPFAWRSGREGVCCIEAQLRLN